ncbi:unnamed protein product [Adineta steineri]|uniref:G-protein coupled receptors family 1 profile domain-containing protein n=2 Tax=Adineta steineri TaxID=433720 RepID=A0A815AJ66_9BILA|nr:unnamed protein product [Adineta steineri]
MSSQYSSNLVVTMQLVQTYTCQIVGSILIFIGTVGCIFNLIIFSKKTLRKNPCSIYFIAYNIVNLLYIYCNLLYTVVSLGYDIDPAIYSLVFCRLHLYASLLFHCLNQYYLILASIDRMFITSRNANRRRRSTKRLAYICIIIGTIFWALFHSHTLIFTSIIQFAPYVYVCYFQPGAETTFVAYYTIITETLVLVLMITCGLCSLNNIRKIRRIRAISNESVKNVPKNNLRSASSKDRQFVFMLIVDIIIYTLFTFVLPIFLIYGQITQNDVKSFERTQIENIIRNLCLFSITIPSCLSCYANFAISKTFRNEIKTILLCR